MLRYAAWGLNSDDKMKSTSLWFSGPVLRRTFSSATINKYLARESFGVDCVHWRVHCVH